MEVGRCFNHPHLIDSTYKVQIVTIEVGRCCNHPYLIDGVMDSVTRHSSASEWNYNLIYHSGL